MGEIPATIVEPVKRSSTGGVSSLAHWSHLPIAMGVDKGGEVQESLWWFQGVN